LLQPYQHHHYHSCFSCCYHFCWYQDVFSCAPIFEVIDWLICIEIEN
jgi:hypothetical protein